MSTGIICSLNLAVQSGPTLALSSAVDVDAYDRIVAVVPNSSTTPAAEVAVDVQPGAAGRVRLLLIRSDAYGDKLKYKVHDTANPAHTLNDALLLVGAGNVELLESPLDKLLFINTLGKAATIEILVGRRATA